MKQYLTFVDISKNRRKIIKVQKESVFVRLKSPAAILPPESANCMQSRACFSIPLGELIKIKKTDATFKKSVYHLQSLYSKRPTQPNHSQPNLIWRDEPLKTTFKYCFKMQDIAVR
jgi:hypothetical protein